MTMSLAVAQPKPLEDLLAHLPKSAAVEYRRGQMVYTSPQSADRVYVVTQGKILVSRVLDGGKHVVVDICQPPQIFGESALANCVPMCEQAVALEPAKVMSWSAAEIVERATRQSRLGMALLELLAQRESELTWRMGSLAVDSIYIRVARSLIRLADRIGTRQEDGSLRMPPLTHKMLSQYIGSTREIVTHHMNAFRKKGYLSYSRNGIVINRECVMEWLERNSHGRFAAES